MPLGLKRNQIVMIAVMLTGTLLAVLNATFMSPALPTIMEDLGVTRTTAQWLTSGYSLIEACVIPLSAYLMGRFPTRRLFITGMFIFGAGCLVALSAPAFPFLLAGRMLQAVATGMVMPMVMTVILLMFPRERRGSAMGIIGLIIGFAPAIGPSLSGVLVDNLGWRWLFGTVLILTIVVIVLAIRFLENFGEFERTSFDPLSVVLSTVGLLCLLYGLSSISSATNIAVPVVLIVVGLAIVGLYAYRQLHLDQPMLHIDILKTRRYVTAVGVIMILQATLLGLEVITPLYIQDVRGYSATVSGVAMLPGAVIGAIAGVFAGRLFDRFGVRKVVLPGACVMVVGGFLLTRLGMDSPIIMVTIAYTVMAFGLQFITTPVNTWGVNSLDNSMVRHAQPLSNTLNQVAGSCGTALLVSISSIAIQLSSDQDELVASEFGDHAAFCGAFVLMLIVLVLIVALVRNMKGDRVPQAAPAEPAGSVESTSVVADGVVPLVASAMNADPYYVSDASTVRDAIRMLDSFQTSGVPVVDAGRTVVGFISDGDIADYLGSRNLSIFDAKLNLVSFYDNEEFHKAVGDLLDLGVMSVATKHVVSVSRDMRLDAAIRIMADRHIKKMPVVDADGKIVGTLSRRDVIRAIVRSDPNRSGQSEA